MLFCFILIYFNLFYFILTYFNLIYFILFYFKTWLGASIVKERPWIDPDFRERSI